MVGPRALVHIECSSTIPSSTLTGLVLVCYMSLLDRSLKILRLYFSPSRKLTFAGSTIVTSCIRHAPFISLGLRKPLLERTVNARNYWTFIRHRETAFSAHTSYLVSPLRKKFLATMAEDEKPVFFFDIDNCVSRKYPSKYRC
jgi:hypothetical protein